MSGLNEARGEGQRLRAVNGSTPIRYTQLLRVRQSISRAGVEDTRPYPSERSSVPYNAH